MIKCCSLIGYTPDVRLPLLVAHAQNECEIRDGILTVEVTGENVTGRVKVFEKGQ